MTIPSVRPASEKSPGHVGMPDGPAPSLKAPPSPSVSARALTWAVGITILIESLYVIWTASRAGSSIRTTSSILQRQGSWGLTDGSSNSPCSDISSLHTTSSITWSPRSRPTSGQSSKSRRSSIFATNLVLLYLVMKLLFGERWQIIPLVALAGASFSMISSIHWRASGLHCPPLRRCRCSSSPHQVRHNRSRPLRLYSWSLTSAIALASMMAPSSPLLFIVLMTILIWPVAPGSKGCRESLTQYWPAWVCHGASLPWTLVCDSLTPPSIRHLPFPSGSASGVHLALMDADVRSARFRLDPRLFSDHAYGCIWCSRSSGRFDCRDRHHSAETCSRRPWVLFVITCLAFSGLVGSHLPELFGLADAGDVRYVAFDSFFLSICLGLALMPLQGCLERYWVASVRRPVEPTRQAFATAQCPANRVSVLVVGYSRIGGRRFRLRRCTRLPSEPHLTVHRLTPPAHSSRHFKILAGGDVSLPHPFL